MPTTQEFIEMLKNAPLSQIAELRKALEEAWCVSAAPPVVEEFRAVAAYGCPPFFEERDEFSVMLHGAGEKKIEVIKIVRTITGLGLAEAKSLVESAASGPKPIKESCSKLDAEALRAQLEAAGAKVTLQ
jgi:large subunit ribosomal protein L7/L12